MDGFFYVKIMQMKNRLFVFCISCISFLAQTQVTRSDFKSLIPSIEKEDWKYVFKRSGALLEANPRDSSEMHAMMVYIRLFSVRDWSVNIS